MDRRTLLKGATALAGIPILGRYVLDNPTLLSGTPGQGLLVPEKQPLVIASELPARKVTGFYAWPDKMKVDVLAGGRRSKVLFSGDSEDFDDLELVYRAFRSGRRFRIYMEPEPT